MLVLTDNKLFSFVIIGSFCHIVSSLGISSHMLGNEENSEVIGVGVARTVIG